MDLAVCRLLIDETIAKVQDLDNEGTYLRVRDNRVAYPEFNSGVVKILKEEECTLT